MPKKMNTQAFIDAMGQKLGIPKWFHDAIFNAESAGGNPHIHDSSAGAIGPGQIMLGTGRMLGLNDQTIRDPARNIEASLRLQKQLLDKYRKITKGNEDKAYVLAAAAYNSGEENVRKHGGIPPFAETQGYVKKVAKYIAANRPKGGTSSQTVGADIDNPFAPSKDVKTPGLVQQGNLDPYHRKVYKHPDDSGYGTTYSISFEDKDGKNVLIPQIVDGRMLSKKQAIDHYYQTGEHFGKFDTWQNADKYANALHESQDVYMRKARPDLYKTLPEMPILDQVYKLTGEASKQAAASTEPSVGKKPAFIMAAKKGGTQPSQLDLSTFSPQQQEAIKQLRMGILPRDPNSAKLDYRDYAPDIQDPLQKHLTQQGEALYVKQGIYDRSQGAVDPLLVSKLVSQDTRQSFLEGVMSAAGGLVKEVTSLTGLTGDPLAGKSPISQSLTDTASAVQQGALMSQQGHISNTAFGPLRQAAARGSGAALIELPKLMAGSFLGAANLPLQGAAAAASEGGSPKDVLKATAWGVAYHYGGGITGQYMGKVGNSLFWIGVPAVEQHVVDGVPLDIAIGQNIPMGLFAGAGGSERNRIKVQDLRTGEVRNATPLDIPKIVSKSPKLQVLEPEQAVMHGALQQARQRVTSGYYNWRNLIGLTKKAPSFAEEGFVRVQTREELDDLTESTRRLLSHRALRDGLEVAPPIAAKNFFKQLHETVRKFAPKYEKAAAEAEDSYINGDYGNATMRAGGLIDLLGRNRPLQKTAEGAADWKFSDDLEIRRTGGQPTIGQKAPGNSQEGFAALPKREKRSPLEKGIPRTKLSDVVTIGAFHYEAGSRTYEDWIGRMGKELGVPEDRMTVGLANQLGEVYARSKTLVESSRRPIFFSGLKQTIKELKAQQLVGDRINPDRLLNLLKQRGLSEELKDSGLEQELLNSKKNKDQPLTADTLLDWLDLKGMTLGVLQGGMGHGGRWQPNDVDAEEGVAPIYDGAGGLVRAGILPQATMRSQYVSPGVRNYFEGVVHSNKAMNMSTDDVHFGIRPDQISWYRGGLLGDPTSDAPYFSNNQAILEEVQSKRNQLSRRYGVTEDPDNVHSRLISLQRENDILDKQARDIEQELQISRWEPTDEYSRYEPDADQVPFDFNAHREIGRQPNSADYDLAADKVRQIGKERLVELDKLRAAINSNDHELAQLEHQTDSAPVPWSPHLSTWYEPALKGFLREAAERLEPDQDGNIRVTWASATQQAERYNLKKLVDMVEWTKNTNLDEVPAFPSIGKEAISSTNPATWDVTIHFRQEAGLDAGLKVKTVYNLTERKLGDWFGADIAKRIVGDEYDYRSNPSNKKDGSNLLSLYNKVELASLPRGLIADSLPIGGEWAVSLYGDTAENISKQWPGNPNLLRFAWRTSGNEALVPGYLERYAKGMGGRIELKQQEVPLSPEQAEVGQLSYSELRPQLIIPEQMRQMILRGQLFYGKALPVLPKGNPLLHGIRNIVATKEQVVAAREKLQLSKFGGQEGFLGFGKKAPILDPRVSTDIEDRTPEEQGLASKAFRNPYTASPVRYMLASKDPRVHEIEQIIYDTKTREHDFTIEWSRRFSAIIDELKNATFGNEREKKFFGKAEQKARLEETYSKFIDLIEKPYKIDATSIDGKSIQIDNPNRTSGNPVIDRALQEWDSLTTDWKKYLMDSFEERGQKIKGTPEEWGITGQGYFRHLFMGDTNLFLDGEFTSTHNYFDAVIEANKILEANPEAKVELKGRPITWSDPAIRVSTKNFERFVGSLVGKANKDGEVVITGGEVRYAASGILGKKENVNKFFGATLKREGHEGYSRAFEDVTKMHMFQLARTQELSKLQKQVQPLLEELNTENKKGEVAAINQHLNDLWGKPMNFERTLGDMMKHVPGLRSKTIPPDQLPQVRVRQITNIWNVLKLKYNPKSILINDLQPLRTLWPFLETRDVLEVVKLLHDPKWKQVMTDAGIMKGTVKLETTDSQVQRFGFGAAIKDPFTYVSGLNRARGYTAGVVIGKRAGLNGYELHKAGLRWADQVEFDNSKWNAPMVLRNAAGKLFGQYKGFMLKDIENTVETWQGNTKYKQDILHLAEDVPFRTRPARVAKWFAGTAAFGGVRAGLSPLTWMGTALGYSTYLTVASLIKSTTGASDKDAKFLSSMVFLGAPAGAGLDISSSLTTLDEPTGVTWWEKAGRFLSGPTVTGTADLLTRGRSIVDVGKSDTRSTGERIFDVATKLTPYARIGQRGYQAEEYLRAGTRPTISIDQHRTPLTGVQTAAGIFGIPPASQTLYYEEKDATGKSPFAGFPASPFSTPFRSQPFKQFSQR